MSLRAERNLSLDNIERLPLTLRVAPAVLLSPLRGVEKSPIERGKIAMTRPGLSGVIAARPRAERGSKRGLGF